MLKKILLFLGINIFGLSVMYTLFNLPVLMQRIQGDLSDILSINVSEAKENREEDDKITFLLDENIDGQSSLENYDNFPGKDYLEKFLSYMDERKGGENIVKKEIKNEVKKENDNGNGLVIIDSKKVKKKNIFDLTKAMNDEEKKLYGNESWIVIPKLGIKAPIHYPNVEEYDLEGVILKLLEKGVAHRPETQLPDQNGNFFLIGHSSNLPWIKSKYNNIFASIGKLKEGDIVKVYYKGRVFTYKMYTSFIVPPEAVDVYGYIPGYNLSLMTCWPIGTDKDRLIVRFQLEY